VTSQAYVPAVEQTLELAARLTSGSAKAAPSIPTNLPTLDNSRTICNCPGHTIRLLTMRSDVCRSALNRPLRCSPVSPFITGGWLP
jgi:hypothetical protein